MIHSLGELPIEAKRGYYIYLLDYGWYEPLGDALRKNFNKMADLASKYNAVVIQGTVGSHFEDEVLSFHHVDGQPAGDILPAILITTRHPHEFGHSKFDKTDRAKGSEDQMLLIPLRKACKTTTNVATLIDKIFRDIREKKALEDFEVAHELHKGKNGAIVNALILQPNFAGIGIDLKTIISFFKKKE